MLHVSLLITGHIKVNGKRVNIASYQLRLGDVVEVREKSKTIPMVITAMDLAEREIPDYVQVDSKKMTAQISRVPQLAEVPYPVQMEPNLVIEFYSK